ncbi:hypothetical protein PF005_g2754 [Phytophthora fragariae]|uniref:Uncharacterized protein n=1 Tax=Phytophthora fragariae TaxID=53985 RepID=A0A6A3ZBC0_9STRA|nr:hypothetical protein PF005_g2754 [Phytophthora fragariae]
MRVLIVNAYPASSKRGRERFEQFRRHVTRVVRELQKAEVTRVEIVEKHRSNLDSFLFELHSEFADPHNITNFDQLDFVFVDGDANSSPWAPNMRKLTLLTKMCMMTGKCFFGSGIGASLVAFCCSTGGEHLRVINNDGKGSLLDKLQDVPPPPPDSSPIGFVSPRGGDNNVLLDIKSGDFFIFAENNHSWVPKGNTGLVLHSSDSARCYGARPNSARAGGKKSNVDQIRQPLFLAKRGELRCCIRLEVANQHPVITTTFPRKRELVLNCKSKWDLDEEIASTGVVNDAPYTSEYEQEAVAKQRSKLRWMGGPFRTVIGKASTHVVPEASIFIEDPFVQKNMPFYMVQRRQLDSDETNRISLPHQHGVRRKTRGK